MTNTFLEGIVQHYVLFDIYALMIVTSNQFFWGVPCNLWLFNESYPLLDNLFSGITFCAMALTFPCKICLSINRFLAIAFDGRFYRTFEQFQPYQYASMVLYSTTVAIPFLFPGCRPIFIPYGLNIFYMEKGECGTIHAYITQILVCWFVMFVTIVLDSGTFYLIRIKIRKYPKNSNSKSNSDLKKDLRLAAQMLADWVLGTFVTASFTFGEYLLKTNFQRFLLFTSFWQLFCVLKCLANIIFLRESDKKSKIVCIVSST